MRRIFFALTLLTVTFSLAIGAEQVQLSVLSNGEQLSSCKIELFTKLGRTMVPLRLVAEKAGLFVEPDGETLHVKGKDKDISLRLDSNSVTVDGVIQRIDVGPTKINEVIYIPLKFFSEVLGAEVNYDKAAKKISMTAFVDVIAPQPVAFNLPKPIVEVAIKTAPTKTEELKHRFTSLIIDARGFNLKRSMSPVLRKLDGSILWDGSGVDVEIVIEKGLVCYQSSLETALVDPRCGKSPMQVTAVGVNGSDPILSDEDSARILAENKQGKYLDRLDVILLYGSIEK
jgi:hypothetical protein